MYSIYSDSVCIHEDVYALPQYKVLGAKLILEENSPGELAFTIPPGSLAQEAVKRLTSVISVRRDGEEIWSGRVLEEGQDFWNRRSVTCEGELGYLNDSIQPQAVYTDLTVQGFLEKLLEVHNSKCGEHFTLGAVTMNGDGRAYAWETNYENTMSCIAKNLVEVFGGRVRVRKVNGVRYLDYLAEYPNTCTQVVEFGKNLLDFTRNWDLTDLVTVVIPRGKQLEKPVVGEMEAYTTVESVNGGSDRVISEAASRLGYIEAVVDFPDISDPAELLEKAMEYLREAQFEELSLEVSMADLHLMSSSEEPVDILDQVRCRSYLHGLDKVLPVTKIELPLDRPDQAKYTLGKRERTALSETSRKELNDILDRIDALPSKENVLAAAKENADAIMNMATNGFITVTRGENGTEELYISDTEDYQSATRYWRWNVNGLAYYNKNDSRFNDPNGLALALTMDGAIVANFITVGTMSADRIRTGRLESTNGNTVFDLDTGELTMRKGSIQLGAYRDGHYNFEVDNNGNLYARTGIFAGDLAAAGGTFGGKLVAASGDFKGVVQAEDFLDRSGRSMRTAGTDKFSADYLDIYGLTVRNKQTQAVTFKVDGNGNVTINGSVSMGAGSTIDWNAVGHDPLAGTANQNAANAINAAANAQSIANTAINRLNNLNIPTLPSYITATKITQTTVESPTIVGGEFHGNSFTVYPPLGTYQGTSGVNIYTIYNGHYYTALSIQGASGDFPAVTFSGANAAYFNMPVYFTQGVNGVNVQATFA